MRALVQRVSEASVTSRAERDEAFVEVGRIGGGLVALIGVTHDDTEADARKLADKIANLRVFDDADGVMNESVLDVGGGVLVVSQFTLYGDTRKGRRPSYVDAAKPDHAEPLVEVVQQRLAELGVDPVAGGRFRTEMQVSLTNHGPVTLSIEV